MGNELQGHALVSFQSFVSYNYHTLTQVHHMCNISSCQHTSPMAHYKYNIFPIRSFLPLARRDSVFCSFCSFCSSSFLISWHAQQQHHQHLLWKIYPHPHAYQRRSSNLSSSHPLLKKTKEKRRQSQRDVFFKNEIKKKERKNKNDILNTVVITWESRGNHVGITWEMNKRMTMISEIISDIKKNKNVPGNSCIYFSTPP